MNDMSAEKAVQRIKKLLKKEKIKPMSSLRQMVIALISSCMLCRKLRTPRNNEQILLKIC